MATPSASLQFHSRIPAICVGLDQTGAVIRAGAGWKPLPAAVAVRSGRRIELFASRRQGRTSKALNISALNRENLLALTGVAQAPRIEFLRVLVDAVLGLPANITSQIQSPGARLAGWFEQARVHHERRLDLKLPARGRDPAEDFFATLLKQAGVSGVPTRECERLSRANSVFIPRPYQKNVQTGTYRIWVELGGAIRDGEQFRFPHHDGVGSAVVASSSQAARISIEESWPSLIWRGLLEAPHREPGNLSTLLEAVGEREGLDIQVAGACLDTCRLHPDHADALVLALAGVILPVKFGENPIAGEGWITGLARP